MAGAAATTRGFGSVANTAGTRAGGLQTQIGNLSPKMIKLGAAVGVTGLALKDAVGDSIAWESAFAGVRKTVDASEAQFGELASGIREMATEIPTTANELAAIAESAGQLGIETNNILEFTRVIADLGETTNLAGQEAATTLARFANITGMQQEQFKNLGSSLVRLGNNFETTEAEVASFGLRIAAAGSLAGMTEGDILGIGAAMSSVGVQAERGGTAVNKVISSMIEAVGTANEDLEVFAETAGMTAEEFSAAWRDNPGQAFAEFVQGLGSAGDTAFAILDELGLKDERLVQSFLSVANAGDLMTESIQASNEGFDEAKDLSEEAQQRYDTLAAKIDTIKNKWDEVSITIGDAVVPAVDKAVDALGFLAEVAHPDTMHRIREFLHLDDVMDVQKAREFLQLEDGFLDVNTARQWLGLEEPTADIRDFNREVQAGAMDAYVGQLNNMAGAAKGAAGASGDLAGELGNVADAGYDAADGLAASAEEAMKTADPVFALFDAWRDYEDAIVAADEAIAKHGAESHEAVQAGQDLAIALMELQAAASEGSVDFGKFEATLDRWVAMGRITAEQADTIRHGVDHARESAEEFAGDYTATLELRPEGFQYLDGLDARLAQITRDRTVSVRVDSGGSGSAPSASSSPSAGGTSTGSAGGSSDVPGGLRAQFRAQGGPVQAGRSYWVGEEGPELLTMGATGGFVTPEPAASAGLNTDALLTALREAKGLSIQEGAIQITGVNNVHEIARRVRHEIHGHNITALELGGG